MQLRIQTARWAIALSILTTVVTVAAGQDGARISIGLPVDCAMNEMCFVQQYPDMAPAADEVTDPWCGGASYDGHDGTDIRVRSLVDMAAGVPVIAVAAGTVLRVRDAEPDHLVVTPEDRAAVLDKECGNGLVVDHGHGLETQYCHLRQGSIIVKLGQDVVRGDALGMVGASGLAQFPHVHLSVRQDGQKIDPTTGREIASGACSLSPSSDLQPLWDAPVLDAFRGHDGQLMEMGFADAPIDHSRLVEDGAPPIPTAASNAIIGWSWMINLQRGDQIHLRIEGPGGDVLVEDTTEPMERNKATQSVFIGKRGRVLPGAYTLAVWLVRKGIEQDQGTRELVVQ